MKLYLFENKALREVSHSQLKITWRCGLKALFSNIKLFRTKQVYSLISNNKAWHSVFSFYGLPEGISKGWFKICTVISNLVAQKILFHLRFYYENWIWHAILISQILFLMIYLLIHYCYHHGIILFDAWVVMDVMCSARIAKYGPLLSSLLFF